MALDLLSDVWGAFIDNLGAIGGALGVLSTAVNTVMSVRARKDSKRSIEIAERTAAASEQRTKLIEEELRRHKVTWQLVHLGGMRYELINQSARDTAYHVRLEHTWLKEDRNRLELDEVGPGSSVPLFFLKTNVFNPLERLKITWFPDRNKAGPEQKAELAVP